MVIRLIDPVSGQANDTQLFRTCYVTYNKSIVASPAAADQPKRDWLRRACSWATGATTELQTVARTRNGFYNFAGQASPAPRVTNVRYGYRFADNSCGAGSKASWDQLVDTTLNCNYSDCFIFSDVLKNMSGVLGLAGFTDSTITGSSGMGFLTVRASFSRPQFSGKCAS